MRTQEEIARVERVAAALFVDADPLSVDDDNNGTAVRDLADRCLACAVLFAHQWHLAMEHDRDDGGGDG